MISVGQVRFIYAQYPYESKPAIKYTAYKRWKVNRRTDTTTDYSITVPGFFAGQQSLNIKVANSKNRVNSVFSLFKNGKPIGRFVIDSFAISPPHMGYNPKAVYIEDINGDGLNDLKIAIPFYGGCGGFNFYAQIIYLLQQANGKFKAICFNDWMDNEDFPNRPERDFDGDHNFEIVTKSFQNYGTHNYELYNLYDFRNGKLFNVNAKADYPLLIQLLWEPNYKATNKVPKKQVKKLAKPLPDDFEQLKIKWF